MVRGVPLGLLLLLIVVGLSFAPPASAACQIERVGAIALAVPTTTPPPLNQDDAPGTGGTIAFVLVNIVFGQPFYLYASSGNEPVAPCVMENCVYVPDFNVAFFKASDDAFHTQVGQTFSASGPESGQVPGEAEYALIWMRHGTAAEFVFAQQCSAPPV